VLGLTSLAAERGLQVIAATHSPAFLRHDKFRLHHVARDREGNTAVRELPAASPGQLADLGLDPADLLQLTRVFLIVEGRHEQIILDAVLGEELEGLGARVLAMRGAASVSDVLTAQFLFEFTTARVVVVLDNPAGTDLAPVWREAVSLATEGQLDDAKKILLDRLNRRIHEQRFVQEFGIKVLESIHMGRIDLFTMSVPDVLDLLPIRILAPGAPAESWAELRSHPDAPTESGRFKKWLEQFEFAEDEVTLRRAAESLDAVPSDLTRLLDQVRRIGSDGRMAQWDHRITVAIANDEPDIRGLVGLYFEQWGPFQVVGGATTGREALSLLESVRPDVLLLDTFMPDLTGMDVLPEIRARYPQMRIIVYAPPYGDWFSVALDVGADAAIDCSTTTLADLMDRTIDLVGRE
jgi:CheY-like chemotaxis protein